MQLLSHGAIIAILLFGGVLASVLGLVLLVLYKRTIASTYAEGGRGRTNRRPGRHCRGGNPCHS